MRASLNTSYIRSFFFLSFSGTNIVFVITLFRPWDVAMVAAADSILCIKLILFVLDDMMYSVL